MLIRQAQAGQMHTGDLVVVIGAENVYPGALLAPVDGGR